MFRFLMQVSESWTKRLHAKPGYSPYEIDILRLSTCVEVALRCLDADREKRPCVEDIVHELGELESRIKTIMLLPHDHRKKLLTNLGLGQYSAKSTRIYMSHKLAHDGAVAAYKSDWSRLDPQSDPTGTAHGQSKDLSLQVYTSMETGADYNYYISYFVLIYSSLNCLLSVLLLVMEIAVYGPTCCWWPRGRHSPVIRTNVPSIWQNTLNLVVVCLYASQQNISLAYSPLQLTSR